MNWLKKLFSKDYETEIVDHYINQIISLGDHPSEEIMVVALKKAIEELNLLSKSGEYVLSQKDGDSLLDMLLESGESMGLPTLYREKSKEWREF